MVCKIFEFVAHCINFLHFIIGLVAIVFGVIVVCTLDPLVMMSFNGLHLGGIIIGGGGLLATWALIGLYGVCQKNRNFLVLYIFSTVLVIVMDITIVIVCIVVYATHLDRETFIQSNLRAAFEEYRQTGYFNDCLEKGICIHLVDQIQYEFECCGLTNHFYVSEDGSNSIPGSCCSTEAPHPCEGDDLFTEPCGPIIHQRHLWILMWLFIGFIAATLIHIVLFLIIYFLLNSFDDDYYLEYNVCTYIPQ